MNRTWLALSTVALAAWYAIFAPSHRPAPMELRVVVLPRRDSASTASQVVVHVSNVRLPRPLMIASCGGAPRLVVERRVDGNWKYLPMGAEPCALGHAEPIGVATGRSLASRLTIPEAGEYRVSVVHGRGFWAKPRWFSPPLRSREFEVKER